MSNLWVFACLDGLRDGLNPCVFISASVFILLGRGLQKGGFRVGRLRAVFMLVYALGLLEFDFGPGQNLILQEGFMALARMIYAGLGLAALGLGAIFLRAWGVSHGRDAVKILADKKPGAAQNLAAWLLVVLSASLLSVLATIIPVKSYMAMISYGFILKGNWTVGLPVLAGYIFCSLWPLWLLWAFMAMKNLRDSLVNIVYSSIFFTASSSMLLILSKR